MLKKLTHVTIMVRDQAEAAKYYVEKLGMVKRMDSPMESFGENARWVTVGIPDQPEVEIILQATDWGPGASVEERIAQIGKGPGFVFEVDDCHKTYQELLAKGVQFFGEPADYPWGIQAVFADLYGNIHLISQSPQE